MKMKRFKNDKYNNELPEIQKVFKNELSEDGQTAKLTIYGDIGESWWGDSVSAKDVERELKSLTVSKLNVHLNSYGGDVFDGIAIYNQLRNHEAEVVIHVDGIAASAASIIAMAGDKINMNTGSMMMIHEGSTFAFGTKTDIKKTLNALEGIDKSIANIYMTRYKGEREEIDTMIVNETWFTSDEAVAVGLADEEIEAQVVTDPEEYKNSVLAKFKQQKSAHPFVASTNKNILKNFKRQSN